MDAVTRTIYVFCGLPFSGKTTKAQELTNNDTLLIERDRFLEALNRDPIALARLHVEARKITQPVSKLERTLEANAFNDALTGAYVKQVIDAIHGSDAETIIVDGTHLHPLSRSFIRSFPNAKKIAVVVNTDPEICLQRLLSTATNGIRSTITPDLIRRMSTIFEQPTREEGFDEIITA